MESELEFYQILFEIVKGWPATYHSSGPEETFKRINSFAVIDNESELFDATAGKDQRYKQKEYFFSRHWDHSQYQASGLQISYPAVFLWEKEGQATRPFESGSSERIRFEMAIIDKYFEKFKPGVLPNEFGTQRTKEEIKNDLRVLRRQLTREIGTFVKAETTVAGQPKSARWFNRKYLDQLKAASQIDSFKITHRRIGSYLSTLEELPTETVADITDDGLVGTYLAFNLLLLPCASVDVDYSQSLSPEYYPQQAGRGFSSGFSFGFH